jgi:ketosteroid isomerase-like protein
LKTIIAAEQKLAAAHLNLDLSIIDDLLHADYLILQPNGLTESKADVLTSYASGERRWDAAEVTNMTVSVFGNTARVVGVWSARGENRGQPFDYRARFVSVWVDEGKGWQNITYFSAEF